MSISTVFLWQHTNLLRDGPTLQLLVTNVVLYEAEDFVLSTSQDETTFSYIFGSRKFALEFFRALFF